MQFNSFAYAIFLCIVFLIYWCIADRYRWVILLLASYYFYGCWNVKYLLLIFFTTAVSYICALLMEKEYDHKKRKACMYTAVSICLGVLFLFKYLNFSFDLVKKIFILSNLPDSLTNWVLPVGISFYTFQTMSYVIDVYKGDTLAEHHFGKYALYVSFFPQLVAGPIERSRSFLKQIHVEHKFQYEEVVQGMSLIAWGLMKKMVIADNLAIFVDRVYNNLYQYTGGALILATIFFSIQIYCDFSGYSDIAIGTAKLFSINLTTNFKSPYFSCSVREFWSRWHISLSTWFKDYVYIPLGGNRNGKVRTYLNLMLTFILSGLWHGANLTFVIWGGVHGIAQCVEKMVVKRKATTLNKPLCWIRRICVFVFVTFAWMFFRANSLEDSVYILKHAFDGVSNVISYIKNAQVSIQFTKGDLLKIGSALVILFLYDFMSLKQNLIQKFRNIPTGARWLTYYVFAVYIIMCAYIGQIQFVYFQF